ncbi:MAG TPA: TIGR02147 family protein [Bdellovibrionales bacterium]|nr:TIGR02147 family protein [Bdellovibrionales bacterium]
MTDVAKPLHVQMLEREFDMRRAQNGAYSLRAFARDLKLAPSLVSEILSGKKGLSKERAEYLIACLGLNEREQKLFVLSSQASHARGERDRRAASEELRDMVHKSRSLQTISEQDLALANNWFHLAIMELIELESCRHQPSWMAGRLGLPEDLVVNAIQRLIGIGWIEQADGKYRALSTDSETDDALPSDARKRFHLEMMKKAEQALVNSPTGDREYGAMTLSFRREQMQEAKKMIRRFQREFGDRFSRAVTKDSVYQMSVQFFRLDQGEA